MSDYISRQAAIELINSLPWTSSADQTRRKNLICIFTLCDADDVRENVRGEWLNTGFMEVKCSNCKEIFHELESANYCPNCGADMRGEKHERK